MMELISLPSGVGFTAILVAGERHRESCRPDALFKDPLAAATVAYVSKIGGSAGPSPYLSSGMQWVYGDAFAIRTCFLDERILAATAAGVSQVVLLAAGMDGRSCRLAWPQGTRIFELDRAGMIQFKHEVLDWAGLVPTADLVPVAGDLSEDWPSALRAAGFAAERPTVWLVEGILLYLDMEAADNLVSQISRLSAPSSHLLVDYGMTNDNRSIADHLMDVATPAGSETVEAFAAMAKLFGGGPPGKPDVWLSSHGWQVEATTAEAVAKRLGRPVPPSMDPERGGGVIYHLVDARLQGDVEKTGNHET